MLQGQKNPAQISLKEKDFLVCIDEPYENNMQTYAI